MQYRGTPSKAFLSSDIIRGLSQDVLLVSTPPAPVKRRVRAEAPNLKTEVVILCCVVSITHLKGAAIGGYRTIVE
jgi:hypothetical protein